VSLAVALSSVSAVVAPPVAGGAGGGGALAGGGGIAGALAAGGVAAGGLAAPAALIRGPVGEGGVCDPGEGEVVEAPAGAADGGVGAEAEAEADGLAGEVLAKIEGEGGEIGVAGAVGGEGGALVEGVGVGVDDAGVAGIGAVLSDVGPGHAVVAGELEDGAVPGLAVLELEAVGVLERDDEGLVGGDLEGGGGQPGVGGAADGAGGPFITRGEAGHTGPDPGVARALGGPGGGGGLDVVEGGGLADEVAVDDDGQDDLVGLVAAVFGEDPGAQGDDLAGGELAGEGDVEGDLGRLQGGERGQLEGRAAREGEAGAGRQELDRGAGGEG
jgi:hypothetical protein